MKLFKEMYQGAGYLPGFGEHPGNVPLCLMILLGGVAAIQRADSEPFFAFVIGAAIMALVFVPFWLMGCVARAREYNKINS